jgi:hypothetical protein
MALAGGSGPLLPALEAVHSNQSIFSYGISDTPGGIQLYKPGTSNGILVTGKPTNERLPSPFDQEPSVGQGQQIHHKFVVCGFNQPNAVVYCGSSNLALGGEESNGDNLIAINDGDVATVFAIEALALVDHFHFRNASQSAAPAKPAAKSSKGAKKPKKKPASAPKQPGPSDHTLNLFTNDAWTKAYYTKNDLRQIDKDLFG